MSNVIPGVTPNQMGVPPMAPPPLPGAMPNMMSPQAPSFGAPMAPVPMGGVGAPVPGIQPGAAAIGTAARSSNIVICGYMAPHKNALKRVVDEATCRRSYKALYEAYTEEQRNDLGERQCLDADGVGQTTTNKTPKMVSCTSTFSMTAFRTFMREDGVDKNNNHIPGFNTIRERQTYQVDMSENTAEYWIVKYLVSPGSDTDVTISSALSNGHVYEYTSGLACLKVRQFQKFVYAVGKASFPIVSLNALKAAAASGTTPAQLGILACKKGQSSATNGSSKINLGVYTNDLSKCSVRQLGLNDDGTRVDEVGYITLRRNITGEAMNLNPDQITNYKAFSTFFPNQNVASLSKRKNIVKADFAGPGISDDEQAEKFKAAKAAEFAPFEEQADFCATLGLPAEKYADLAVSRPAKKRGMKPAEFRAMTDDALSAITAIQTMNR